MPYRCTARTMAWQVSGMGGFAAAHCSASANHASRTAVSVVPPPPPPPPPPAAAVASTRVLTAFWIISATFAAVAPLVSSNRAAVTQIDRSNGNARRARFSTFFAASYVSRRAKASHNSTAWGQHSTARLRSTLASSSPVPRSTAAFHSTTDVGIRSSAFLNTRLRASASLSSLAAASQSFTLTGKCETPLASKARAVSASCKRAASNQISSLAGHSSQPRSASCLASEGFPATSSRRATAIHPGAWVGLDWMTDRRTWRVRLMSEISASEDTCTLLRSVK
mmetsp:Transcript_27996/g.51710  ORF Transcript_27996/g.51710 Transcript_27996/m.51710 type:complete len:281 (-) Transcript_27996:820-1662(-)